jgi:hypothetical protein
MAPDEKHPGEGEPTPGDHEPWRRAQERRTDRATHAGAQQEGREEESASLGEHLWTVSVDHMVISAHYHRQRASDTCLAIFDTRAQRQFPIVLGAKALDLLAHGLTRRAEEALQAEKYERR